MISLIAEEMKNRIPQFEPYSSDYQMVVYASKDLEEWMRQKLSLRGGSFYEALERMLYDGRGEFRVFVKSWVTIWLGKWRERVKLLHTKPKLPPSVEKRIKEAKRIYRRLEFRKELKNLITRKLISQGEICMAGFIAENLIIEEIARRLRNPNVDPKNLRLDPIDIYNALSRRVLEIQRERGPLIYLRIKPNLL
ncbi:hypothetical protein J7L00_08040 [Candidatus Bathyarchaeota archaeon]|nr:hypothetical protein [Candidatus Bathyarchaeota archaeon]